MLKIIETPKRPESIDLVVESRQSMILLEDIEDSAALAKIQRWLDIGDSALQQRSPKQIKKAA